MYYFNIILNDYLEKIRKIIGLVFIVSALLGLYGWIGTMEPECYYTSEIFVQYRLCDRVYETDKRPLKLFTPAICLILLGVGMLFLKLGNKKSRKQMIRKKLDEPVQ